MVQVNMLFNKGGGDNPPRAWHAGVPEGREFREPVLSLTHGAVVSQGEITGARSSSAAQGPAVRAAVGALPLRSRSHPVGDATTRAGEPRRLWT